MPLESERPFWLRELPSGSVTPEDNLSRAIEDSEEEGQRVLERMQSRSSRFGAFYSLNNDSRGLSAVHLAVLCKRYGTLHLLLSSGLVDINQYCTNAAKKGWTALHFAAFTMDLEAIHILLSHSCDTSVRTELGSTPLHFVNGRFGGRDVHRQSHVLNIMKTLIVAGVDPKATNHYGFSVLHESIMWSDVTSLCVMLEQSTAHYFERLLLIGSHVLPHELAGRSPTLPPVFQNMLENAYFVQKQLKESTGVTPKVKAEFLRVCEKLEFICNPSPPTVERVHFPHPESLTARDVGSLLRSAPQGLVVEALKFDNSILEYRPYSLTEARYVFPAYFSHSLAEWVCTDCRECRVVAGRWFNTETEKAGKNVVIQLMTLLLSESSFRESTAVAGAAYFSTLSGVQLGIRYVDRVRSQGVLIHVCSSTSSTNECRKFLEYVVDSAYQLHGGMGPVSVVSSRDLRTGKSIPHLFSRSEISRALASHMTSLSNPTSMPMTETLSDLLLFDPQTQPEAVDCDGVLDGNGLPQRAPSHHCDEWSQEVYSRAVESHRDDSANPNSVADFLVSEAVLSQSDQSYEDDESNSPCGSLSIFYLEPEVHSAPPFHRKSTHLVPVVPRTAPSGIVTEESSGYGTLPSTVLSTQPPSFLRTTPLSSSPPPVIPGSHQSATTSSFQPRGCHKTVHSFVSTVCKNRGLVSCVESVPTRGASTVQMAVSVCSGLESSFTTTPPIVIPSHSPLSSPRQHDSTTQPQPAAKGSPTAKRLSQQTSLFQRFLNAVDAVFSAPKPSTNEESSIPGLKQF